MAPSVLLVGAGGALGVPLIQEFIKQKSKFSSIAILATDTSKKAKFAEAEKAGIEIVVGGLLEASSYKGFEFVISLVGNPLLRLQPAMIDLAYSAGVRHFYPSEFGLDMSQDFAWENRYFRSKQDTRCHLIAKAKANPDFKYTLVMNGLFLETTTLPFAFDEDAKTYSHFGGEAGNDAPMDVVSLPDVCRYTVQSVLLPSPTQKREIKVRSVRTCARDIAAAIGRAKGIEVKLQALDKQIPLRKQLEAFHEDDEAGEYYWSFLSFYQSGYAIVTGELSNDMFDFKPEGVDEALKNYFSQN